MNIVSSRELNLRLMRLSQYYYSLRERFREFSKNGQLLVSDSFPIRGIRVENNLDRDYFDVYFVGLCYRFAFSICSDEHAPCRGVVTCFRIDSLDINNPEKTSGFTFSSQGLTNIQPPDSEGCVYLDTDLGASYLILTCLNNGLPT